MCTSFSTNGRGGNLAPARCTLLRCTFQLLIIAHHHHDPSCHGVSGKISGKITSVQSEVMKGRSENLRKFIQYVFLPIIMSSTILVHHGYMKF